MLTLTEPLRGITDAQFKLLLDLYHGYYEAFQALPNEIKRAFDDRLFNRNAA